jgi:uncharacterized protein (TIGR02246 family)
MRNLLVVGVVIAGIAVWLMLPSESQSRASPAQFAMVARSNGHGGTAQETTKPEHASDKAAIQSNIDAFVKAYNAHDAKQIAALFIKDGQVVSEDDVTTEGRGAIEKVFTILFADWPQTKIEVSVTSIRFIGSDLAVEVGTTKTMRIPGDTPESGKYTVLHAKRDGQWFMALARDSEGESPTPHQQLQPLAWMVGEWIDESPDSVVFTSCHWSEDKNFILQDIKVQVAGKNAMKVSQRIGWDALTKRIRSWVFDSEGGFVEGFWTRYGDTWIVKSTGVRSDGTSASSTNVFMRTGQDNYSWRSTDRVAGDEVLPDLEVKVVRKPPEPSKGK